MEPGLSQLCAGSAPVVSRPEAVDHPRVFIPSFPERPCRTYLQVIAGNASASFDPGFYGGRTIIPRITADQALVSRAGSLFAGLLGLPDARLDQ